MQNVEVYDSDLGEVMLGKIFLKGSITGKRNIEYRDITQTYTEEQLIACEKSSSNNLSGY